MTAYCTVVRSTSKPSGIFTSSRKGDRRARIYLRTSIQWSHARNRLGQAQLRASRVPRLLRLRTQCPQRLHQRQLRRPRYPRYDRSSTNHAPCSSNNCVNNSGGGKSSGGKSNSIGNSSASYKRQRQARPRNCSPRYARCQRRKGTQGLLTGSHLAPMRPRQLWTETRRHTTSNRGADMSRRIVRSQEGGPIATPPHGRPLSAGQGGPPRLVPPP